MKSTGMVDQSELRVTAALGILVLAAAFIVNRWELVAFQAGVLFLTALRPTFGPYIVFYHAILQPAGIVKPDVRADNLEPHRFAALFGTVVSATAAVLLATGSSVAGWAFAWLLISLAAANFAGWCAGCFTYYTLHRLGLRGVFKDAPIDGTFPGARPPKGQ